MGLCGCSTKPKKSPKKNHDGRTDGVEHHYMHDFCSVMGAKWSKHSEAEKKTKLSQSPEVQKYIE